MPTSRQKKGRDAIAAPRGWRGVCRSHGGRPSIDRCLVVDGGSSRFVVAPPKDLGCRDSMFVKLDTDAIRGNRKLCSWWVVMIENNVWS